MAKRNMVTSRGILQIEKELNDLEREMRGEKALGNPAKVRALSSMADGIRGMTRRLKVHCGCYLGKRSGERYCLCASSNKGLITKTKLQMGYHGLSGARLDLAGNCRDKAGKFVPVRNCTGRGPAAKTRKKAKKKAKRR